MVWLVVGPRFQETAAMAGVRVVLFVGRRIAVIVPGGRVPLGCPAPVVVPRVIA